MRYRAENLRATAWSSKEINLFHLPIEIYFNKYKSSGFSYTSLLVLIRDMEDCGETDSVSVGENDAFQEVMQFLINYSYPERMKGNAGLKSNLRKRASRYAIKDGVLYYKHKPRRNEKEGKYNRFVIMAVPLDHTIVHFLILFVN